MPYILRFMIDKELAGCGWVTLPKGKFRIKENTKAYVSRSQVEIDIDYKDIIANDCNSDPKWAGIAPLRIMSFDIECMAQVGFPIPERDPVITIACYLKNHGVQGREQKIIFQIGSCETVVGADLRTFKNDKDLIAAFSEFLIVYDPDVLTGYNMITFD